MVIEGGNPGTESGLQALRALFISGDGLPGLALAVDPRDVARETGTFAAAFGTLRRGFPVQVAP